MDQEIMVRLDRIEGLIETYVKNADGRMQALEERIDDLDRQQADMRAKVSDATEILQRLLADEQAVLKRNKTRCALDCGRVREAAQDAKYSRLDLLREWDDAGRLNKGVEAGKLRYTKKVSFHGVSIRAVIINL